MVWVFSILGIHLASFAVYLFPVYTDLSIAISGTFATCSHVGDIEVLVGSNSAKLLEGPNIWSMPDEIGHQLRGKKWKHHIHMTKAA